MQWLPPLVVGGAAWRLPLAGDSAAAWAANLTHPSRRWLTDAAARDPALALWALAHCAMAGRDPGQLLAIKSVVAIGEWLTFATVDFSGPDAPPVPSATITKFEALRAAGIWVSGRARKLASVAKADPAAEHESCLLGLLHGAAQWLRLGTSGENSTLETWLPQWLFRALKDLEKPGSAAVEDGTPVGWVRKAIAEYKPERTHGASYAADQPCWLPELVQKLNRLAQLESSFQETLEAEKLEAMAEFAAGAGHEINNPIAVIAGRAQLFLRHEQDPDRRRELALMNTQALRVYEMIADMMLFARPPQPRPTDCDLSAMIDELLVELEPQAAERKTNLRRGGSREPLPLAVDAAQLSVALRAVLDNALQALGHGGNIEVAARSTPGGVEITITDDGPGISAEIRRHLFDPYFSGRGAGRGLGLGLSKCWRIVTNHGGQIAVDSTLGRGAKFTITLPGRAVES